ncbi:unnamed protein product, partial [Effrenium voratum]
VLIVFTALHDFSCGQALFALPNLAIAAALPVMLLIHASTSTACTRLPSLVTLWEPAADCGDDEHDYMDLALRLRIGRGWETSRHLSPPELPTSASISGAPAEMSLPCSVNPFASPA